MNAECQRSSAPLLVRWANPDAQEHVTVALRDAGADPAEVADLVRRRSVLVLSDLTLPPSAPPFAAAAFRIDRQAGTAHLIAIGVPEPRRRQGLGRRLLSGTLPLLRAEGVDRVQAWADPHSAGASLLLSAGFAADHFTVHAGGSSRFLRLL
jgi:GNAT superfamily N-acetyltransferase